MYDDDRVTSWAGGGGWNDEPPAPPPPPPPPERPKPRKPAREASRMAPFEPRRARGLVCGRFLPLHRGHEHVLSFAKHASAELTVLVFGSDGDPVPMDTRVAWIADRFPGAQVIGVRQALGEGAVPNAVAAALRTHAAGARFDCLFGSDVSTGRTAATAIGATFVPVDPDRVAIPTSGTDIRADPMGRFDFVSEAARPWIVRRVAVVGAESTGKSTLCRQLAEAYATCFVPEHARGLAAMRGGDLAIDDIAAAARGQMAAEDALVRQARRVLFCDTDVESIQLWSQRLFEQEPEGLAAFVESRPFDLTIFCASDVPFVGAPERDDPEARRRFDEQLRGRVAKRSDVIELRGPSWDQRVKAARTAVDRLLARRDLLSARGRRI